VGGSVEPNTTDIEIFFKAVQLQEIGKLQGSDIPAAFADLALQVMHDFLEIDLVKARPEELIPESFPVKAQAHALAGLRRQYNA
jgi:hypothetical protein